MATNKEWLFSLPLDELYAWFDSEHHEGDDDSSGGSTEALRDRIDELERRGTCDFVPDGMMDGRMWLACTSCNGYISASYDPPRYCPHCGAKVGGR